MTSREAYGESLARRILTGAGSLNLVPYRLDPAMSVPVIAHGLDGQGRLLVVCTADVAERLGDTPVRVDGVKKALEFDVDITVASLHALAELRWRDAAEEGSVLGISLGVNLRVGVLEVDTVLLHGPHGVTRRPAGELLAAAGPGEITTREIYAREQIARLSAHQLSSLLSNALVGMAPGVLLSEAKRQACFPAGESLWVVDIDHAGVVLLKVIDGRMYTVLVAFPEPVTTISDLAGAVDALASHTSVRHASPRI